MLEAAGCSHGLLPPPAPEQQLLPQRAPRHRHSRLEVPSSSRTRSSGAGTCTQALPGAHPPLPPHRGGGPLHSPFIPSLVVQKMEASPCSG